jgi:hypothetical protein
MTVTFAEYTTSLLDGLAGARLFAELLVIVSCVTILTLGETIRDRPAMWSGPASSALFALAAPLGLASVVSIAGRFVDLLR